MPLFKGALTGRRYLASGPLPEGWRTHFQDQLEKFALKSPVRPLVGEETTGWVLIDNLLDTGFAADRDRWCKEPYLLFGLRIDRVEIPKDKLKAMIDKAVRAWCQEQQVERCPRKVKKQIQEQIEEQLASERRIKMKLTEVAWNVNEGYVLLGTLSNKVNETFCKLFKRTFGIDLRPDSPLLEAGLEKIYSGSVEKTHLDPAATCDWLTWLLAVSQIQGGADVGADDRSAFLMDRVMLDDKLRGKENSVTVKGHLAAESQEVRTAIREKKRVVEAQFELRSSDVGVGALTLKGELPDVSSLRFPNDAAEAEGETDERVVRLILYEGVVAELRLWADAFATVRRDAEDWESLQESLLLWANKPPESEEG